RIKTIDELAEEWAQNYPNRGRIDAWTKEDLEELRREVRETVTKLKDTFTEILAGQTASILMDWYLIGKEIMLAKQRMRLQYEDVGPKGWSGIRGKLMTDLSREFELQKNELYDA